MSDLCSRNMCCFFSGNSNYTLNFAPESALPHPGDVLSACNATARPCQTAAFKNIDLFWTYLWSSEINCRWVNDAFTCGQAKFFRAFDSVANRAFEQCIEWQTLRHQNKSPSIYQPSKTSMAITAIISIALVVGFFLYIRSQHKKNQRRAYQPVDNDNVRRQTHESRC